MRAQRRRARAAGGHIMFYSKFSVLILGVDLGSISHLGSIFPCSSEED